MINTTELPIILLDGPKLDKEIRSGLSWAVALVRRQQGETNNPAHEQALFERFLGESNRAPQRFDERFLLTAFKFATTDAIHTATKPLMSQLVEYLHKRTVAATGYPVIKRGLKLTLVELWRRGALLLPTVFTPGTRFTYKAFDHELLTWLLSFDPLSTTFPQKDDARRLYTYGPRLLLATNWRVVEDVSIEDIAELSLAQRLYMQGKHPHAIAGLAFPWSQLPSELIKAFPERVSFDQAALLRYSAWSAVQAVKRGPLETFEIKKNKKEVAERPRQAATQKKRRATEADHLADAVKAAATHDAVLLLFQRFARRPESASWQDRTPTYPGREHINLSPLAQLWVHSFKAFLHHRKHVQGYRTSDEVISSLNILADYLFFYLPWWKELYPSTTLPLPKAPKEFARYAYVSRHDDPLVDILPTTLLQVIRLRRQKPAAATICIKQLTLYFRFVGAQFADDEEIAGLSFRNPLNEEFDRPRVTKKKNKTNKQIIPQGIYGHLLFWCYAVEAFGEHLLKLALEGRFIDAEQETRTALRFDTEKMGSVPMFRFRGKEMRLCSVPNVFAWAKRDVIRDGTRVRVMVPHLTALRLLIVSLETGLRCQSVQWLDRLTWDSPNTNAGERYTYRLFVNTDKTKIEPWSPPIVFRVRHVLQREQVFQERFADLDTFEPVAYEGLDASPFDPIRPLFKAPNDGRPILDKTYAETWVAMLIDFEVFYKEVTGERHVRLYYIKPSRTPDGQPIVRVSGRDACAYCAFSVLAVYTPHSCRATFATNRQGHGILELSDVAEILGHAGIEVTAHYTNPSGQQLEERLQRREVAPLSRTDFRDS